MTYQPKEPPELPDVESLRRYVQDELSSIAREMETPEFVVFQVRHVAPTRPTAGMLAFADGTDWNPGSGRGMYEYRVASWVKL